MCQAASPEEPRKWWRGSWGGATSDPTRHQLWVWNIGVNLGDRKTPLSVYIVALSQQKLAPEIRGVPIQHYPLEDSNIDPDRLRTENFGPPLLSPKLRPSSSSTM